MDQNTAIQAIVEAVGSRVTRGFDGEQAAWAHDVLRELLVPAALAGWHELQQGDVDGVISDMLAELDADEVEERYGRLAVAYFTGLLQPTAHRARDLARSALFDGIPAPDEGSELMEEVATFMQGVQASAPALVEYFVDDVEQVLLDCLTAVGETDALSRALQIEVNHIDAADLPNERVGAPDEAIDQMAATARASLAVSREAADFARRAGLGDREQLLAVRRAYDHALAVIEDMQRVHGNGAVRRVSDDLIRADLLEVLEVPITADEWDADSTPAGIIRTRLSRDV